MDLLFVNLQVKQFMAHRQFYGDLLEALLQPQKIAGLLFHSERKRVGVAARSEGLQPISQASLSR